MGQIKVHLLKGGMSKNVWVYFKPTILCNSILFFLYIVLSPFFYPLYGQENWDLEKLASISKLQGFCSVAEPRLKLGFSDFFLSAVPLVCVLKKKEKKKRQPFGYSHLILAIFMAQRYKEETYFQKVQEEKHMKSVIILKVISCTTWETYGSKLPYHMWYAHRE